MKQFSKGNLIKLKVRGFKKDATYQIVSTDYHNVFVNTITEGIVNTKKCLCFPKNKVRRINVFLIELSDSNFKRIKSGGTRVEHADCKTYSNLIDNIKSEDIVCFYGPNKGQKIFCTITSARRLSKVVGFIEGITPGHREFFVRIDGINLVW